MTNSHKSKFQIPILQLQIPLRKYDSRKSFWSSSFTDLNYSTNICLFFQG